MSEVDEALATHVIRQARRGEKQPDAADARRAIGRDRSASGNRFFRNSSSNPAVCFPVDVPAAGWYQVVVTAGATSAQSAPSQSSARPFLKGISRLSPWKAATSAPPTSQR